MTARLPTDAPPAPVATRNWTLRSRETAFDVAITARDDTPLEAVLRELAGVLGTDHVTLWAGSTRLDATLPLTAPALAHGAFLGLGESGPRAGDVLSPSALELQVVGGPDAGRVVGLTQGRHLIGRGSAAAVALEDPDVSRRHAVVEVGVGEVLVSDLGSTNGTRVDGTDVGRGSTAWPGGGVLRIGSTTLALRGPGASPATLVPSAGGRLAVRPSPRLPVGRPRVEVSLPRPPADRPPRRLAWAAVVLPIAGGLAMSALLHTATFLFFTVLGPVAAAGTWLSDRWAGRRTRRQETAAYEAALASARQHLAEALTADRRAAHDGHPDLAALAGAARRRTSVLWSRRPDDADALTVRLGIGRGTTNVTVLDEHSPGVLQHADDLPSVLDLRATGGLGVVGPRVTCMGVVRSLLTQLATLHDPGTLDLVLLSRAGRLDDWRWARWLPHLSPRHVLSADDHIGARLPSLLTAPGAATSGPAGWRVVVVDRPLEPAVVQRLRAARDRRVLTVALADSVERLPATGTAVLRTGGEVGETAMLSVPEKPETGPIVLDRFSSRAAAVVARDLAPLVPPSSGATLPEDVRLVDLLTDGLRPSGDGELQGTWSRSRRSLIATLGRADDGPFRFDLCRVGPHALVAGTTGSGKSELLQTLIASLALQHPPDRCSFLLVDYKGGAAFAEAATLPHTVGMLTDLDASTTARALRSLAAELARRESLLAAHAASDVSDLPDSVDLARLVIVVDEFATLAEELPDFVPGLVGIAQRGRSLGVHLVLATQRPGGVVSPEIRANCTLRLCLRTTDEADSRDIIGAPDAAHLPVELPGRCFIRTGRSSPTQLQAARVSTPAGRDSGPPVRRWIWPPTPVPPGEPLRRGSSDLAALAACLRRLDADRAMPRPHRPWLAPLPDRLSLADLAERIPAADHGTARGRTAQCLTIGLVDRPDTQSQEPLCLDLDAGGGWLAVGGPRSGRTTMLRTVLASAIDALSPADLHVHVLDHGGGALAAEATLLPHTGTSVGGHDALRSVRLVDRLAREVEARRSGQHAGPRPRLLLLVDGAEALLDQLDESDPSVGAAAFLRLVRDGGAAGLTCVLTADRAVPGGRLAAVAGHRLVLPLADRADYAVAGIRAADVPAHRPPGRALWGEDAVECQLAMPPERVLGRRGWEPEPGGRPGVALRIVELPADPFRESLPAQPGARSDLLVRIGPGGDGGELLTVDLARTGGLLVVGPPGSGRSAALDAMSDDLRRQGTPLLRIGGRDLRASGGSDECPRIAADDSAALAEWLAALDDRPAVVLADDVGPPTEWPTLAGLLGRSLATTVALLAAGTSAGLSGHYQGPVGALRRQRTGLLLRPGPADADLLALRLPRTPLPARPGCGWLVRSGELERVQVARLRPADGGAPLAGRAPGTPS